jgi:hypothetical protein
VVLTVTGAEALYADLGHFGRRPIRLAWFGVALPALLLNYFGQGALVLRQPEAIANPFYHLAPAAFLYPLVGLATVATVVASQALISGVFSLTQQAIRLRYVPRMTVVHTSRSMFGQIYLPAVNTILMIGCLLLVLAFRSSTALAGAYGVAVTGTMAITSILFFAIARYRWRWPWWSASALTAAFLIVDLTFLAANTGKIPGGGWVPLAVGALAVVATGGLAGGGRGERGSPFGMPSAAAQSYPGRRGAQADGREESPTIGSGELPSLADMMPSILVATIDASRPPRRGPSRTGGWRTGSSSRGPSGGCRRSSSRRWRG